MLNEHEALQEVYNKGATDNLASVIATIQTVKQLVRADNVAAQSVCDSLIKEFTEVYKEL